MELYSRLLQFAYQQHFCDDVFSVKNCSLICTAELSMKLQAETWNAWSAKWYLNECVFCLLFLNLFFYTRLQSITIHCRSSQFHGTNMCSQSPHCFALPLKHHTTAECELRREQTAVFVSDPVDRLALLGIREKREIRCISHPARAQAIGFVWEPQMTDRQTSTLSPEAGTLLFMKIKWLLWVVHLFASFLN